MSFTETDEKRWNAVRARDGSQVGVFVYAVQTTGIYCRPGCSAKLARRENVRFFATPAEAEEEGFRACKRCRPNNLEQNLHAEKVRLACERIRSSEEEPDLATLARGAGMSPGHFQRVFKDQLGLSPKRYAMAVRKEKLREGLEKASSVTEAIFDAGYNSSSRAYADNETLGIKPGRYRKGAGGERIRFATAKSSLGDVVVAATEHGICTIELCSTTETVERLKERFPHAQIDPADNAMNNLLAEVIALVEEPGKPSSLPLDIRGTAFQERVWQALTQIPSGQTISYAGLAKAIGQPGAARAVAGACAANRIALLIPCHRVIKGSGEIGGYRWGVERKRAMLKREAEATTEA